MRNKADDAFKSFLRREKTRRKEAKGREIAFSTVLTQPLLDAEARGIN